MNIILTHEQTDFDGIASLLGAYLLDENLVPVLPRRINRNVRAFLTLYGLELPFVDPRDLTGKPVESVCLVDTQSLTSVKGMSPETKVSVIDHHSPRPDIPEEWTVTLEELGANTTIFVEAIQKRDLPLTPIQATLLLLGIYEDTGSLTYTRTTPRDIYAAGYLLEQAASMAIVADYVNHPLSLEQQDIYEVLRAQAESHIIHGHSIVISQADAQETDAELSALAHKMRDLLDPDALFLLFSTGGGVQLIARSSDDHINVADVAVHFEGGGHPRAAAALIREKEPGDVRQELVEILPDHVQPAITAGQIMSRDPQILSVDTSVEKAQELMIKYGYEGYPVVKEGKIAGLLTRRAVDRALTHQLNLTAASLMEAGEVSVYPQDSIEKIQNVMTDTGWGQIPVVDPKGGPIIGIVTRTDLLKILAPSTPTPGRQNLAPRLKATLPAPRLKLLQTIASVAQDRKDALYIVGGFVRDLLLDYPSLDFDLVVEGDAIALAEAVRERFGGRITTHDRFGTAKWFLEGDKLQGFGTSPSGTSSLPTTLDFITARTEFYTHPTALPTVKSGSIKLDLHRRDFTINTLALRLDGRHYGELYDYWGGLSDLKHGLVRVLHSLSFVDDPTRMLRAVRYEQRYDFKIDDRTQKLLLEARPLIDRVSGDRIRHEFNRIFEEEKVSQMMERLQSLGVLEAIHPALLWDEKLTRQVKAIPPALPPTSWGLRPEFEGMPLRRALLYTQWLMRVTEAAGVIKTLKLNTALASAINEACHLQQYVDILSEVSPSAVTARLRRVPVLAIYANYLSIEDKQAKETLEAYMTQWRHVSAITTGHDLQERGLPPGPRYAEILTTLRSAWLDGEVGSEEEEREMLEALLGEE
ncbi:MAG: CCA-adding enzyme [Chloroflexi bacterium]|nr:CCA-adding enzyme [Chloroflexota bacterium]